MFRSSMRFNNKIYHKSIKLKSTVVNLIKYWTIKQKNIIRDIDGKIVVELKKDCFHEMSSNNNTSFNGHGLKGHLFLINLIL